MSDLDMELQTIRQKLQTLKASPPETVAAPWGQSRLATPSPDLAQVTNAIETLRQRSTPPAAPSASSLQQFDAALSTVENLAQQQQQALKRLKTLGDSLTQQIQPGSSPDVDDIARFLADCQPIQIPTVHRDLNGYLNLGYHTVIFDRATHLGAAQLFQPALEPLPSHNNLLNPEPDSRDWQEELSHLCHLGYRHLQRWIRPFLSGTDRPHSSNFTLMDASIWCIGAIIGRLILNQILRLYPAFWTPIALVLIAGIIFSLYRAIFSPRPNPVLGYRTLMLILGLLIGGRFG